jgi:2-dehydro-3-deoxy-L-rhamnonate dehydrogenase (NAD+)
MNQIDLAGRVAVVTGGKRGIGEAVAARLTSSGAKVAIWDLEAEDDSASRGNYACGFNVDVSDNGAIEDALARTEKLVGPIDILVNSAGISGPSGPTDQFPIEAWRRVIEVNLTGVFFCCRAVVPNMRSRGYGRIVNIASIAGKDPGVGRAAYAASKAGVISLTKSLGKELASTEIRVNCVTPAAVLTPLLENLGEDHIKKVVARIPIGRLGTAEEIASLVAWLASAECSFSTGAAFDLSGGRVS